VPQPTMRYINALQTSFPPAPNVMLASVTSEFQTVRIFITVNT
jgi:hypothetical protein